MVRIGRVALRPQRVDDLDAAGDAADAVGAARLDIVDRDSGARLVVDRDLTQARINVDVAERVRAQDAAVELDRGRLRRRGKDIVHDELAVGRRGARHIGDCDEGVVGADRVDAGGLRRRRADGQLVGLRATVLESLLVVRDDTRERRRQIDRPVCRRTGRHVGIDVDIGRVDRDRVGDDRRHR